MTVYVDNMKARHRGMLLCHMIADTDAELHAMADAIGISRRWFQGPPNHRPHYDISLGKRSDALNLGAQPVSWRDCALMTVLRKTDPTAELLTPVEGQAWLMIQQDRKA